MLILGTLLTQQRQYGAGDHDADGSQLPDNGCLITVPSLFLHQVVDARPIAIDQSASLKKNRSVIIYNRTGPVRGPVLRPLLVARWIGIVSAVCVSASGRCSSDANRHSAADGCNANVMNAHASTTHACMTNASAARAAAKCEGVS